MIQASQIITICGAFYLFKMIILYFTGNIKGQGNIPAKAGTTKCSTKLIQNDLYWIPCPSLPAGRKHGMSNNEIIRLSIIADIHII